MVAIFKAWKNDICEGSIPVGPAGIITSWVAVIPTLATVAILFVSISGLNSNGATSLKINPILFLIRVRSFSSYGIGLPNYFKSS